METIKARIFISCGQQNDREKDIGLACKDYFERRGFVAYFAEEVHSLESITENIFTHLRNSEYFVFIDFCREKLPDNKCRGSVFVNQEIAIAAFRNIETIGFHELGVSREGVIEYLITHPIYFSDKEESLKKLEQNTKEWRPDWRNELSFNDLHLVHRDVSTYDRLTNKVKLTDWYILQVSNNHKEKYARNCVAYVSEIEDLDNRGKIDPGNYELGWSGTELFEMHILPKRASDFVAFYIIQGEDVVRFYHQSITSTLYKMPILSKGNYQLTYLVVSENFDPVTKTFKLEFAGDFKNIKFYAV